MTLPTPRLSFFALTLALLGGLALTACGGAGSTPTPVPNPTPKISGATVTLQLSEKLGSVSWTYPAGTLNLRRFSGTVGQPGAVFATASSNAQGVVSLSLPDGDAVNAFGNLVPLETLLKVFSCQGTLSSSNPAARGLAGLEFDFSTDQGGLNLLGRSTFSSGLIDSYSVLVFTNAATSLSSTSTCGGKTSSQQVDLAVGWNAVYINKSALGDLFIGNSGFKTPLQITKL